MSQLKDFFIDLSLHSRISRIIDSYKSIVDS